MLDRNPHQPSLPRSDAPARGIACARIVAPRQDYALPGVMATPNGTIAIALPQGSRVGEFTIASVLGAGRHSIVYSAHNRAGSAEVVLKEYLPFRIARRKGSAVVPSATRDAALFNVGRRHFLREANQLSRVCHASLAAVLRSWEQNGTVYVAVPLYRGEMLEHARASWVAPPAREWLERFVRPLLDMLDVLHRRGLFGIDLSESNVMLLDGKFPVLMGFGPHWNEEAPGSPLPLPAKGAWSDIQALARLMQGLMAASADNHPYPEHLVQTVVDAASGEPGRTPNRVSEFMAALGWPERRRRVRSEAESLLSRAARVQGTSRRPTASPAVATAQAASVIAEAVISGSTRSRPPTASTWQAPAHAAGSQTEVQSRRASRSTSSSMTRTGPVPRWPRLAGGAIVVGVAAGVMGTWGMATFMASLVAHGPPSAVRAEAPAPLESVAPSRPALAGGEAPAQAATISPSQPARPPSGPPVGDVREQSAVRVADSGVSRGPGPPAVKRPPNARCSDLLTRISLGDSLDAADATFLENVCR